MLLSRTPFRLSRVEAETARGVARSGERPFRPRRHEDDDGEVRNTTGLLRQAKRWREDSLNLRDRRTSLAEAAGRLMTGEHAPLTPRAVSECLRAAAILAPSDQLWQDARAVATKVLSAAEADFNAEDALMILTALRSVDTPSSDEVWTRAVAIAQQRADHMDAKQRSRLRDLVGNQAASSTERISPTNGREAAERAIRTAKEYKRDSREPEKIVAEFRNLKQWLLESEEARQADISDFTAVVRFLAAVKEDARPERQLFAVVSERILSTDQVESIGSLVWSLGRFRVRDSISDEVVNHVTNLVLANAASLEPKTVSGVLFAFGKIGVWSPRLAEGIAARVVELLPSMRGSDLSSTIWGYAVSDELNESVIFAVAEELSKRLRGRVSDEDLRLNDKDVFVCLWSLHTLLDELPDALKPFYKKKTDSLLSVIANSSEAHRDLSRRLATLGVNHVNELEVATAAGPLVVDIGIPDRRVALEVDGPWHALRLVSDQVAHPPAATVTRYDGPTAWKRRMLRSAGWRVVPITTKEYEMQRDKMFFLKKKLQQILM